MPYIFGVLLLSNVALLGYFSFIHDSEDNTTVIQQKSTLTEEVSFQNSSKELPPIIGEKK